jgi:hypothetical protein
LRWIATDFAEEIERYREVEANSLQRYHGNVQLHAVDRGHFLWWPEGPDGPRVHPFVL